MEKSILSQLLKDMGTLSDVLEITEYDDYWLVVADDSTGIFVEIAEDAALFLWANIGEIRSGTESVVLRLAMQANGLFMDSGGCTVALEGDNNRLQLVLKLAIAELSAAQLAIVIGNFQQKIHAWRAALAEVTPTTTGFNDCEFSMIRV